MSRDGRRRRRGDGRAPPEAQPRPGPFPAAPPRVAVSRIALELPRRRAAVWLRDVVRPPAGLPPPVARPRIVLDSPRPRASVLLPAVVLPPAGLPLRVAPSRAAHEFLRPG